VSVGDYDEYDGWRRLHLGSHIY